MSLLSETSNKSGHLSSCSGLSRYGARLPHVAPSVAKGAEWLPREILVFLGSVSPGGFKPIASGPPLPVCVCTAVLLSCRAGIVVSFRMLSCDGVPINTIGHQIPRRSLEANPRTSHDVSPILSSQPDGDRLSSVSQGPSTSPDRGGAVGGNWGRCVGRLARLVPDSPRKTHRQSIGTQQRHKLLLRM